MNAIIDLQPGDLVYQPDTKCIWELTAVHNFVVVTGVAIDPRTGEREGSPLSMPYAGLEKLVRCKDCGAPVYIGPGGPIRAAQHIGDQPQCNRCLAVDGDHGIETRHEG